VLPIVTLFSGLQKFLEMGIPQNIY